jgi:CDP-diacylglycerol pyrophosphatase
MNLGLSHDTKHGRFGDRLPFFCASAVVAAICACAAFLLLPADGAQGDLPRNTLWEVVHNLCVPGQSEHHNPKPCLQVDLDGGIEGGFAILPDPRGGAHFLLIPTTRISGIESPMVWGPHARNYFADAWEVRTYLNKALRQTLPRDGVGLAINSAVSRSQDQLHIHVSCIRADILEALHKNEREIGDHWALLRVAFVGHYYMAMWVTGDDLRPYNPFRLLAERLPDATPDMGNRTLVVVGLTRSDGTKGFVVLADRVNQESGDLAFGEELLDHACHIAAKGTKAHGGLWAPRSEQLRPSGTN